jgi:thiazole/oxazole-forming peptide maturase SagD family component
MRIEEITPSPPCLDCLVTRLEEAGFSLRSTARLYTKTELPASISHALRLSDGCHAGVVRIENGVLWEHNLLPVPNCPGCANRQIALGTAPSLSAVTHLLDPLLGIASGMVVNDMDADESLLCCTISSRIHVPLEAEPDNAYGQGFDLVFTRAAQLGEAVERYTAYRPVNRRLVVGCVGDLPGPAVPMERLNGFDREQLTLGGFHTLNEQSHLAWIQGKRLEDGKPLFVPAAMVFLNRSWNPDEKRFVPLISHGLACHLSGEVAKQQAILEVYERFCLTVAWHRQNFGVRVPLNSSEFVGRQVLKRIARAGLRLHLMIVPSLPTVPVFLAAVSGERFPWITLGSGTGKRMVDAASHAVAEACGGWQAISKNRSPNDVNLDLEPLTGAGAHVLYYAQRYRSAWLLRQLYQQSTQPLVKVLLPETATAEQYICHLAPDTVVVPITAPDIAACGFHVVKIVAPGLPLFQFGRIGTPGKNRLHVELPAQNTPHPYP